MNEFKASIPFLAVPVVSKAHLKRLMHIERRKKLMMMMMMY